MHKKINLNLQQVWVYHWQNIWQVHKGRTIFISYHLEEDKLKIAVKFFFFVYQLIYYIYMTAWSLYYAKAVSDNMWALKYFLIALITSATLINIDSKIEFLNSFQISRKHSIHSLLA